MARTDATTVKSVMESTGLSDSKIDGLINVANLMVTNNLTGKGLSTDTLKYIETYLVAHLIAIGPERQAMTEKVGAVSATYQGKFGDGLKLTTYGQMVIQLDTSGTMERLNKSKVRIRAVKQVDD